MWNAFKSLERFVDGFVLLLCQWFSFLWRKKARGWSCRAVLILKRDFEAFNPTTRSTTLDVWWAVSVSCIIIAVRNNLMMSSKMWEKDLHHNVLKDVREGFTQSSDPLFPRYLEHESLHETTNFHQSGRNHPFQRRIAPPIPFFTRNPAVCSRASGEICVCVRRTLPELVRFPGGESDDFFFFRVDTLFLLQYLWWERLEGFV